MKRLAELLAIRSGEGRLASLVIGVMLITAAGSTFGSTGVETLFFTRFGVQYLPYMFMVLGLVTMATSLAVTALIGRMSRERLYIALPFVLAIILLVSRAALLSGLSWLYPVLWLGKEVVNTLIGFLVWGVAGVVCDTRQSKRLFPLFNAGRILGAV
ncbi:MAG TPA: hypothetical protein VHM28_05400, partial [Anaerolineales bacterium]|nr:hypothetical protein [Anaerolineales bacterium]